MQTYNSFRRIENEIQLKNDKMRIIFNAMQASMFLSFFAPFIYFIMLKHGELTHAISWYVLFPLKCVQFVVKIHSLIEFRSRFFDEKMEKIYTERSQLDRNIAMSFFDIILEAVTFVIIIKLGLLVDEQRNESCAEEFCLKMLEDKCIQC